MVRFIAKGVKQTAGYFGVRAIRELSNAAVSKVARTPVAQFEMFAQFNADEVQLQRRALMPLSKQRWRLLDESLGDFNVVGGPTWDLVEASTK